MFNLEQITHLAELSKIKFTDEELKSMAADMTEIVDLMDKIKEFEAGNIEEKAFACEYKLLRKDEVKKSLDKEDVFKNAKNVEKSGFAVPKIV